MNLLAGLGCSVRGMVAAVLIPVMLIVPTMVLAQDRMIGAKVSIDSDGAVEVNNVEVYSPDGELYAESGQIMTDAGEQEEEESWYTPTWYKFLIGLATIGVGVGIYFIVDNNIDDNDDDDNHIYYYDSDCDCYKRL